MTTKRKSFSKAIRMQVWSKYDGHCAYCGIELAYKDMQVDHVKSIHMNGSNDLENLMPSCRMCNYYKGAGGIEFLRKALKTLSNRLVKPFINRLALRYGILELNTWDGKFYYERIRKVR